MSYQPFQRNTSGIVFFGEQGNQPTYYSDSNFVIEDGSNGSLRVPNIRVGDVTQDKFIFLPLHGCLPTSINRADPQNHIPEF